MAIISILPKREPRFGVGGEWISFDAILDDALEFSVDYTQFPIEIGASATDHGIIRPATQVMTIAVSNNPLETNLTDFAGGFISNFVDSALFAGVAGLSSGFLSNNDDSRAKGALEFFVTLMYSRTPFDVDSVDITMRNMVISRLRRNRDVTTENGLVIQCELQELPLLSTTITQNQPSISQLNEGDPSYTQAAAEVNRGEVLGVQVPQEVAKLVEELL